MKLGGKMIRSILKQYSRSSLLGSGIKLKYYFHRCLSFNPYS